MKKAMKKLMVAGVLCMAGAAFLAGCGSDSSSGGKQFLNIATGGTAGTYYPLGGALAEILNQNIKGMNASAQSTGASVANVNMLKDGSVDIAFIQNDIAYYAANGKEMFKDNKVDSLRGLAALYPETIQFVTTQDKGIKTIADLKGKKVAVEKGTASHTYASKNLSDADLEVHDTITTAYESLEQKKVDAVIQDGPGANFYIKTTPDSNLEVVGDEFNQGQAPYCVAISKECKYYDEINAAVKVLIKNGTTDELYAKWCE